jgi:lipopolysaccharide export system permease protein
LTALFLFQALLGELLDHEYPATQLLYSHFLNLPNVYVQMTPPAVLLATVLTISGFNRTNELTAMYALGHGISRIVSTIIAMVFILCCFTLVLQDRVLPLLYKKRTTYYWREMKGRTDFYLDIKQNKIWYRSGSLIYNLRAFDTHTRTILGMSVYTFDDKFHLVQVVDADRAEYTSGGWKLRDGTVTIFIEEDPFPINQSFKEKDLVINETPKDFLEIEKEVDSLRIKELWGYINRTRDTGLDTKSYEVKLHSRFSLSFIPLVMCLLGVPFSTRSRREGGLALDLLVCLCITFCYWIFYSIGLSLGTNGALVPWMAAWLPTAVFAMVAAVLVTRKNG